MFSPSTASGTAVSRLWVFSDITTEPRARNAGDKVLPLENQCQLAAQPQRQLGGHLSKPGRAPAFPSEPLCQEPGAICFFALITLLFL